MHCTKKITNDLTWVGANDRRLAMFEGVYSVPAGVSYNSYLLCDDKTVLFDTVDKAVRDRFLENLSEALGSRALDYLVVQHMEPDHAAAIREVAARYPELKLVCNTKTQQFIKQFLGFESEERILLVKENDTLVTGRHTLQFIMAPMVHWPEVMVTYDTTDKILFSADAFGCFGALNGAIFADEVDFAKDYMDETRRYYANIVGKYGTQMKSLLSKVSPLAVDMICPLHGFVWREHIKDIIEKYSFWSNYEPEEYGVMISYASIYGNTENAAEILACRLRSYGVKTVMFDVSVTPASEIVSAAFKWSHLVFASTTYNAGIFVTMEALICDLTAHNLQKRTIALIENGSWAATSGGLIRAQLETCKNIRFLDDIVSLKSSLKADQLAEIDAMASAIVATFPKEALPSRPFMSPPGTLETGVPVGSTAGTQMGSVGTATGTQMGSASMGSAPMGSAPKVDRDTLFKLSYGLFVLTAKDGAKDNGCIINTVTQITESPLRISVAVSKANFTHEMIVKTGEFNVSVLTEHVLFSTIEQFGFQSGRDIDKFVGCDYQTRTTNGVRYIPERTNGVISARVCQTLDYGTHTLFIADVTEAFVLSKERSLTYQFYFDHIKPKPKVSEETKNGFVCKICGYVYEGDTIPEDYICPLCKHGVADFEPL